MDIDSGDLADTIEDTLDAFGSTVSLPGGVKLQAIKVTNEREMARIMRVDGQVPDKVTTVFLFDQTAAGKVGKGTRLVNVDASFIADMVHTEVVGDTLVYIALGCYDAN